MKQNNNLTQETINQVINDASLSKSKKFITLYNEGLEIKEIASLFNVRYNFVYNVVSNHCRMNHIALRKSFCTGYGPMGCPKIKPERGMENNLYLTISYKNHDVTDMYDNVWIVIVECGICRWEKIATIKHNSPYYDKEMSQA